MTRHSIDIELPEPLRPVILSDGIGAVFASLEATDQYNGEPTWHVQPFAYLPFLPKFWQYYDPQTGMVS